MDKKRNINNKLVGVLSVTNAEAYLYTIVHFHILVKNPIFLTKMFSLLIFFTHSKCTQRQGKSFNYVHLYNAIINKYREQ